MLIINILKIFLISNLWPHFIIKTTAFVDLSIEVVL